MKNSSVDLLRGPILRSLLIFVLPILVSNIFQQLYNTADVMIVGRFLGPDALAAVGASTAIFDLVIGFALGVGNGMGVVIARYYGAQNDNKLRQSVAATFVIALGLSISVMLLGHFGLYPLLSFLGTPKSIINQSHQYISMIVSGVGVTMGYNLCAGLLRAVGDSLAALYFLIFSAFVNILLASSLSPGSILVFSLLVWQRLSHKGFQLSSVYSTSRNGWAFYFLASLILFLIQVFI